MDSWFYFILLLLFSFIIFLFGEYFVPVDPWSLLLLSNRLRKRDAARRGGVVSMAAEDAAEVSLLLTGDKIILRSSSLC